MVIREAKKRREAEEAYARRSRRTGREGAGRVRGAGRLPAAAADAEEIAAIVADAIATTGAAELGMKGMGKVMGGDTADQGQGRRRRGRRGGQAPARRLSLTRRPSSRLTAYGRG